MGWLLYCAFETDPNKADLFNKYIDKEQEGKTEAQKAKLMFAKLRLLQNKFEEAFAKTDVYNDLGVVTHMLGKKDIPRFIRTYFSGNSTLPHELKTIYNLLLCGMTYNEIESKDMKTFKQKLST